MDNFHLDVWHWLILGGLLMVAELFTTSFFALLFGVSAIIIGLVSWLLPVHWFIQIMLWLVLSLIVTWVWFQAIYPNTKRKTPRIGSEEIIGQTGMIVMPINAAWQSKVRFSVPMFGAEEWVCRILENQTVQVGERVRVVDVIGNELLVMPMRGS